MAHYALEAADRVADEGISVEVVDLRTLRPLDKETVLDSVRKTGKCLVVYEDNRFGGYGAEVAAIVAEEAFDYLDGPVTRIAGPDVPGRARTTTSSRTGSWSARRRSPPGSGSSPPTEARARGAGVAAPGIARSVPRPPRAGRGLRPAVPAPPGRHEARVVRRREPRQGRRRGSRCCRCTTTRSCSTASRRPSRSARRARPCSRSRRSTRRSSRSSRRSSAGRTPGIRPSPAATPEGRHDHTGRDDRRPRLPRRGQCGRHGRNGRADRARFHPPLRGRGSRRGRGAGGVRRITRTAFPDFRYDLEELLLVDGGSAVVARWTMRGTHRGRFFGVEGTGRGVRVARPEPPPDRRTAGSSRTGSTATTSDRCGSSASRWSRPRSHRREHRLRGGPRAA